jgi:septum formation protein
LSRTILLASASPRRRDLLDRLGVRFRVVPVRHRERVPDLPPEAAAKVLAWHKADAAARGRRRGLYLAADTVVVLDGRILGKPRSRWEAERTLRRLAGRTHEVITAVALLDASTRAGALGAERTRVTFRRLSARTIRRYVATGEPLDKAGAYAIQGLGRTLIRRIAGDWFTVVGLPVALFARMARRLGVRGRRSTLRPPAGSGSSPSP